LNPTVQLLQVLLLANFPSGSSINYYENKLYLLGDDAQAILILDPHYKAVDSIRLFDYPEKRIPKSQKVDLESSAIVTIAGNKHLLALGSASTNNRKKILLVPLTPDGAIDHGKAVVSNSITAFVDRLTNGGIKVVNIEGASVMRRSLILANRGNRNYPNNYLIVTEEDFWNRQKEAALRIMPIELLGRHKEFLGISELCYVESKDMLLFTFTTEVTSNAYDDGTIGSSYIGWVNNVARKLKQAKLRLDGMINLSDANNEFKNQKMEGICVERVGDDELLLHLISDNDNGETKLFKTLLKFNP
jgi:hypothetical protein